MDAGGSLDGTPRALRPIAEAVLALVARSRTPNRHNPENHRWHHIALHDDDLRRIELCAQAALDVSMFHDLYGGSPSAAAAEVQGQRSAPSGVPEAQGCGCGGPSRGCPCS
jgi:hypothetical protein